MCSKANCAMVTAFCSFCLLLSNYKMINSAVHYDIGGSCSGGVARTSLAECSASLLGK